MAEPLNKPWTRYCGCRDMKENLGYCINCGYKIQPEPTSPSLKPRDQWERVIELEAELEELQNLVEYHLRRAPVMDRTIYQMQNIQGFGLAYWRLKNGS